MNDGEPIPNAAHGEDELRILGLIFDLDSQPVNVCVDQTTVTEVVVSPHPFEQLIP